MVDILGLFLDYRDTSNPASHVSQSGENQPANSGPVFAVVVQRYGRIATSLPFHTKLPLAMLVCGVVAYAVRK